MDPITLETAKKVINVAKDVAKNIQKVHDVSKQMKTVAESEGTDQLKATVNLSKNVGMGQIKEGLKDSPSQDKIGNHEDSKRKFVDTFEDNVVVKDHNNPPPDLFPDAFVDKLFPELGNDATGALRDLDVEVFVPKFPELGNDATGALENLEQNGVETDSKPDYSYNTPRDSEKGHWDGDRGNSNYVFNPDSKPSSKNYGNLEDKTYREMGEDLGDPEPYVRFEKGYPVFDKDGGTANGKPLEIEIPEGIDKYIDDKDKISGKVDREKLHEVAFARLAEKYGVSIDELKVFKGDSEPVQRLAQQWGCSEEEVWEKCNNPKHIQRVLHEKEDGKTIQLVPRIYHDNVNHKGGIEKVVKDYQENSNQK